MEYVGIQKQIDSNNAKSIVLLLMFPLIVLATVWCIVYCFSYGQAQYDYYTEPTFNMDWTMQTFVGIAPWVGVIVAVWFLIAYNYNASMVAHATGSRPLSRRENPHIYNIVENLCISCNMPMPKVCVIDDDGLNAYASGINEKTYTVTLTTGIINMLDDNELAGVIGHELTHIRNHDTKLLITSIVFVGIISTVLSLVSRWAYNLFLYGGGSHRSRDGKNQGASVLVGLLIVMVFTAIAWFFTVLTRFAISRKREYMADAGGAELCGDPLALASALRKISNNTGLADVNRTDVSQLFIALPSSLTEGFNSLFATHPDINKRIAILEQF